MPARDNPISVYGFVPYALGTTPSQRFRIEQWLPYLKSEGIEVRLASFADERLMERMRRSGHLLGKATGLLHAFLQSAIRELDSWRYDVILVHRAICIAGPAILERLLTAARRPVIYDFDDAIWMLHTSSANRRFGWLKFPGKTAAICRLSTRVVVGNTFLADYARRFNPAVTVIPTSIDTERFRPVPKRREGKPVIIGWTGSSTSQTHLEMFAPVLRDFFAKNDAELRVVSNRQPDLPGVPHVWRPWTAEKEVEEIGQFDVGIMPMPDDRWSLGKCALKALQYMALGIPAVCSPVGANSEVIQHGENGLLAATAEEWSTSLALLTRDHVLREQLGLAARLSVEDKYSANRCAEQFAQVIRETADQSSRRNGVSSRHQARGAGRSSSHPVPLS